jgi:hypothetical protein
VAAPGAAIESRAESGRISKGVGSLFEEGVEEVVEEEEEEEEDDDEEEGDMKRSTRAAPPARCGIEEMTT